jgi:hypothetical protein
MISQIKLEYYDILNSIRMIYLQSDIPFAIINKHDIKLTYKDIKLDYIDNKNYFVKVNKSKGNFQKDKTPWTKEQKKEFYKQKAKEEREKPNINLNEPWTKENRDEYRRSKEQSSSKINESVHSQTNNRESRSKSPKREFTHAETEAYLKRKANRESRSKSPKREFTHAETEAYLKRKANREKKGGYGKIMIFY